MKYFTPESQSFLFLHVPIARIFVSVASFYSVSKSALLCNEYLISMWWPLVQVDSVLHCEHCFWMKAEHFVFLYVQHLGQHVPVTGSRVSTRVFHHKATTGIPISELTDKYRDNFNGQSMNTDQCSPCAEEMLVIVWVRFRVCCSINVFRQLMVQQNVT